MSRHPSGSLSDQSQMLRAYDVVGTDISGNATPCLLNFMHRGVSIRENSVVRDDPGALCDPWCDRPGGAAGRGATGAFAYTGPGVGLAGEEAAGTGLPRTLAG